MTHDTEGTGQTTAMPAEDEPHVADAADLGFPNPAPHLPEVQTAMGELYRRRRDALPPPEAAARSPGEP